VPSDEIDSPVEPQKTNSLDRFDLPAWLSAAANFGTLLVGVVGVWTTIRVSGLEDYFRSELALRNEQIVQAEAQLRTVQEEVAQASKSFNELEVRSQALASDNSLLLSDRDLLREEVSFARRQLAFNIFQARLNAASGNGDEDYFLALSGSELQPASENPGAELLDAIEKTYSGTADSLEENFVRELRIACEARVQTPILLDRMLAVPSRPDPSATVGDTPDQITANFSAARAKIDAWQRAFSEHMDAVHNRIQIRADATIRARTELTACARMILQVDA